jgi:hypothetical protein
MAARWHLAVESPSGIRVMSINLLLEDLIKQ